MPRAVNCFSASLFDFIHYPIRYLIHSSFAQACFAQTRKFLASIVLAWFILGISAATAPSVMAQSAPGISSPSAGSSVSGTFPIIGTAVIEPFQRYEIYIKQEPNGDDAYIYVTGGTEPVTNGQLAILDANAFAPGSYSIRLRVVKLDGNYAEYFAPGISINQGPTATPTPDASVEPTSTPIPTSTFTPAPQPTPIVGQVTQPQVQGDVLVAASPTPEPIAAAEADTSAAEPTVDSSGEGGDSDATAGEAVSLSLPNAAGGDESDSGGISSQIGTALSIDRLRDQFMTGIPYSAIVFLLVGMIFLAKGTLSWMRNQF